MLYEGVSHATMYIEGKTNEAFQHKYDTFNLFDFKMGVLTVISTMVTEMVFLQFFPLFNLIPYAYNLRYIATDHPLTLFAVFGKMVVEIVHMTYDVNYPDTDLNWIDLIVALSSFPILFFSNDRSYLDAVIFTDVMKLFVLDQFLSFL